MLLDFTVTNFRSFKDRNTFSMEKGSARRYKSNVFSVGNKKLLKSAVIFGGNANGKTNMLTALIALQVQILAPFLKSDTFSYNKDDTTFEINFIKDALTFNYTLSYNDTEIVEENLYIDNKIFFKRNKQKFDVLPENLKVVQSNIRKEQNLLYFAMENNIKEAAIAVSWFVEDLIFINTDEGYLDNRIFKLLENDSIKDKFLKFLQAADFNIIDVEVKERVVDTPDFNFTIDYDGEGILRNVKSGHKITKQKIYDVYSKHKSQSGNFEVHYLNESAGTKIFMIIAMYILQNENSNKIILIDEFDKSFHLELAQALLDVINSENQKNQFIMTSHQPSLMDYKLRQEQIYLVEKNQYGESEIFSIYDFDDPAITRGDFGYMKRYLQGRFGATQIINKSLLLSILEDDHA